MKLTYIIAVFVFCMVIGNGTPCPAEINLGELTLPDMKSGAIYNTETEELVWITAATVLKYPIEFNEKKYGILDVDLGYGLRDSVFAGIAYEIPSLKELGFDIAIPLDISVGMGLIYDFSADDISTGAYVSGISLKW